MAVKPMTVTFTVSPGDVIYEVRYKTCHNGETHPGSYGCCGCEDKCDIEKEIREFCIPNVDWIFNHYKDLDVNVWFTTKEMAENVINEQR